MGAERATLDQAEALAPQLKRRVLIADDNKDAADGLSLILRNMGHEVRTARDGLEALSAVAEFQPDVVLLDIGMPLLSGYEVARRIREQPGGAQLTLIALTGSSQDEDRHRAAAAGFDHHLAKPTDMAALAELLAPRNSTRLA
jgi:CheY-like chemotaxis protein